MAMSDKMQDALNGQATAEIFSAHLYLSMAAYLESIDLSGAASWMRIQYKEELTHVDKLFDFIHERDGRARVEAIDAPPFEWESALHVFQAAHEHEQKVTGLIGDLVDLSRAAHDHATENFLQWYVNEQVEEEASVKTIVQQLKLVGDSRNGLFMLDRELATRVLAPPTPGQA